MDAITARQIAQIAQDASKKFSTDIYFSKKVGFEWVHPYECSPSAADSIYLGELRPRAKPQSTEEALSRIVLLLEKDGGYPDDAIYAEIESILSEVEYYPPPADIFRPLRSQLKKEISTGTPISQIVEREISQLEEPQKEEAATWLKGWLVSL